MEEGIIPSIKIMTPPPSPYEMAEKHEEKQRKEEETGEEEIEEHKEREEEEEIQMKTKKKIYHAPQHCPNTHTKNLRRVGGSGLGKRI